MKKIWNSTKWMLFWILLALSFCAGIRHFLGHQKALEFLGGYLIELSLSMDNLFVFITIFSSFRIREKAQHRALSYGIAGAILLRFLFIFFGIHIVSRFEWVLYLFGGLLVINGLKMLKDDEGKNPQDSMIIRGISKILPMTKSLSGDCFMIKGRDGKRRFTPLFAVVCLIECSDILFAMDSVPAVFSVSTDLFIVYTSNIFAILGLRQFYFILEKLHQRFAYVKYGVSIILVFTGMKLSGLAIGWYVPITESITVIGVVMAVSILVSLLFSGRRGKKFIKG
ncbi:MAG: TerC/Alx family metal homeostasis membrane protein [Firmicutes bacterium]|nr:TerC/Alx family metal homeostasis membrane protein [Bacillota bacterium]